MTGARAVALGWALAALLSGCTGSALPHTSNTPRSGVSFTPDPNGLAIAGTALRIDFGRAPSGVIAALDRELGQGRDLGVAGCPAGITRQRAWDGLVLSFTGEQFVGWRQDGAQAGQSCS